MDENRLKAINNLYNYFETAKRTGNELTIKLLDACAVVYYSEALDEFKIDIIDKYEVKALYHLLSCVSFHELNLFVGVLCDNYRFYYHLENEDY